MGNKHINTISDEAFPLFIILIHCGTIDKMTIAMGELHCRDWIPFSITVNVSSKLQRNMPSLRSLQSLLYVKIIIVSLFIQIYTHQMTVRSECVHYSNMNNGN